MVTSARDRFLHTTELLEIMLLALPLADMLQARRVSKRFQQIVEGSKVFASIRADPCILVKLNLPSECSLSSTEPMAIEVDLELRYDRPVTVRLMASAIATLSSLVYRVEEGDETPTTFPRFTTGGGCFSHKGLRFNSRNVSGYITLSPGVSHRRVWSYRKAYPEAQRSSPPTDLSMRHHGLEGTEVGKSYISRVRPNRALPGYIGSKSDLLEVQARGGDLAAHSFRQVFQKAIPIQGENPLHFKVTS